MTSENQTKQPSKRFAKLEAIPAHARMPFGAKSVLAKLYIARKLTLSASAAVLVISGAAVYAANSLSGSSSENVAETQAVSQEQIIPALSVLPAAAEKADEKVADIAPAPILEEETKVADAKPVDAPSAFAKPKDEGVAVVTAAPPEVKLEPAVKEEVAPVRQIIPIAEGLDLYRKSAPEDHAPPHVADKEPEQPAKEGAGAFSLPTNGVPSEDDMSGFLASTPAATPSHEISVIEPEDLSPTIALPDKVPLPEARPAPGVAEGQKIEFRIVQGPGIKSGFWIGNKEDAAVRRFFVIVKPFLEDGTAVNWKFTNIADGSAADTDTMAVEVTEDAFIALAKESKQLGAVRDPVLGRGVSGSKNVKWRIPSVQGNLLAGWDKETRK
ncbi:hypothetical protein D3C71_402240 [compost metagenome]